MTLFEELILLKEYGKSEDILAEKLVSKQQEKTDMQAKVSLTYKIKLGECVWRREVSAMVSCL